MDLKRRLNDMIFNRLLIADLENEMAITRNHILKMQRLQRHSPNMERVIKKYNLYLHGTQKMADELKGENTKLMDEIAKLNNPIHQQLILGKYLDGKSVQALSAEIGYSLSQANRFMTAAMSELGKVGEQLWQVSEQQLN